VATQVAREVEREIAPVMDAIVRRVLARLSLAPAASCDYTSTQLPIGVSRRAFRVRCSSGVVVGAAKEGKSWRCTRAAWHASFDGPRKARVESANDADAVALLEAAGLRGTR